MNAETKVKPTEAVVKPTEITEAEKELENTWLQIQNLMQQQVPVPGHLFLHFRSLYTKPTKPTTPRDETV